MARRRPKAVLAVYNAFHGRGGRLTWLIADLKLSLRKSTPFPGPFSMMFYLPAKHVYKLISTRKSVRGFHDSQTKAFKHHIPIKRTLIDWRDL